MGVVLLVERWRPGRIDERDEPRREDDGIELGQEVWMNLLEREEFMKGGVGRIGVQADFFVQLAQRGGDCGLAGLDVAHQRLPRAAKWRLDSAHLEELVAMMTRVISVISVISVMRVVRVVRVLRVFTHDVDVDDVGEVGRHWGLRIGESGEGEVNTEDWTAV